MSVDYLCMMMIDGGRSLSYRVCVSMLLFFLVSAVCAHRDMRKDMLPKGLHIFLPHQ
jgi:hypothetical protein